LRRGEVHGQRRDRQAVHPPQEDQGGPRQAEVLLHRPRPPRGLQDHRPGQDGRDLRRRAVGPRLVLSPRPPPARGRRGPPQGRGEAGGPARSPQMTEEPGRYFTVETVGDVAVVRFLEPKIVSEEATQEVGEQLYRLVEGEGRTRLVLDFTGVQFLFSPALG